MRLTQHEMLNCWVSLNLYSLGFVERVPKKSPPCSTMSVCKSHHSWWTRRYCRGDESSQWALECGSEHQHIEACTS